MTAGARVETPIDPRPATRIRGGRENGKNLRSLLLLAQQCWPLSPNSNRWVDNLLHHTFFLLFLLLYDSFASDCPQGPQILNNSKQYEILHSIVSIYCLGVYQKSVQVLKENCWSIQSPLQHRNDSSRLHPSAIAFIEWDIFKRPTTGCTPLGVYIGLVFEYWVISQFLSRGSVGRWSGCVCTPDCDQPEIEFNKQRRGLDRIKKEKKKGTRSPVVAVRERARVLHLSHRQTQTQKKRKKKIFCLWTGNWWKDCQCL